MRVLKWIVERVEGKAPAKSTALGNVPADIDMQGMKNFDAAKFDATTAIDPSQWKDEMKLHDELLTGKLAGRAPQELKKRYDELDATFK
jgi:phosphoenolpyruvate carboxykinase (GTP)